MKRNARRWTLNGTGVDPFTGKKIKLRGFKRDHAHYLKIIDRLSRMPSRPRGVWVDGEYLPHVYRAADAAWGRYSDPLRA